MRRLVLVLCVVSTVAPRKAWQGRNVHEHVKPLYGIQLVQIQPGKRRSRQAGSESCACAGRPARRSVDAQGSGPRGFSSEIKQSLRLPTSSVQRKAASREPLREVLGNRRSR
jgi:hypothetical protein